MEVTASKQIIALVEGRKNGNRQFLLLGQLPAEELDGLMDEPVSLSVYPLEPLKNELASIERYRTDSQRKLIGVLDDIDQLGIAAMGEEWQLNELDEFDSYNKLCVKIPSDGAQIMDYAFENGMYLNREIYEESSIVAVVIYKFEGQYHLHQGIKHANQASEQTVELSTKSASPAEKKIPLAAAISPPQDAALSHQVWVLGISSSNTGSQSTNLVNYNTKTLCKLTLQGWNCAKTPDQDEWNLTSIDVVPSDFEMKISCSLDSIAEIGMNARMIVVPNSNASGSANLRLVAVLADISKCFILELKPDTIGGSRWTVKGIEWSLPTAEAAYPPNYRLKLVSTFEPKAPQENGDQPDAEDQVEAALTGDDGTGFRDNRPRVSLYCQVLAQEHLLMFE